MKAVIIYEPGTASMDAIMAVFPRHKLLINEFAERGEVIGIGAFGGGGQGSMGIFKDRAAAEAFVARDPFVLEGLVAKYRIHDWSDSMLK
ncbi:MAG TPA: YciI family protein [Polyangia bacterium]|nr:YciI family protein [Polyangia bacterium]